MYGIPFWDQIKLQGEVESSIKSAENTNLGTFSTGQEVTHEMLGKSFTVVNPKGPGIYTVKDKDGNKFDVKASDIKAKAPEMYSPEPGKWTLKNSKSLSNEKWKIARKDPKTGYNEETIYTGPKSQIPKGWRVLGKVSTGELPNGGAGLQYSSVQSSVAQDVEIPSVKIPSEQEMGSDDYAISMLMRIQ